MKPAQNSKNNQTQNKKNSENHTKIQKLDPKLVDQIAAGEVVERPASVLKELLENAIDAGSTKIKVKIRDGGKKLIEVQDDGTGMPKEDLEIAMDSHTTSKIFDPEDLVNIRTLGFRGEALASISSVSKVTIITRTQKTKIAYEIQNQGGEKSEIQKSARETGTTVRVEDLFYNVPARKKFLKTTQTEYRKILKTFIPLALIYPNIHFIFESDNKTVYNLPAISDVSAGTVHPQRLSEIVKDTEFISIFYEGEGLTIGGVVAHPRNHASRPRDQYIFVNGRNIWDNGVAKSVSVGASRFIPDDSRIPFAVVINIPGDKVDVNVHPRKKDVRFQNPYRVYSAVEQAVKKAYQETLGKSALKHDEEYSRFRNDDVRSSGEHKRSDSAQVKSYKTQEANYPQRSNSSKPYDVKQSLQFSKMILEDSNKNSEDQLQQRFQGAFSKPSKDIEPENVISASQFLNRYVVAEVSGELWIVDQHAAAERIRFEKLLSEYEDKAVEVQNILISQPIQISKDNILFIKEFENVFKKLGFELEINEDSITLKAVPTILAEGDINKMFMDVLNKLNQVEDFTDANEIVEDDTRNDIIATMACHSSVTMNQKISDQESKELVQELLRCENSYSCPHGRPIVWRLTADQIDKNFDRH